MTSVVHVRDVLDRLKAGDPLCVYIGRAMPRWGIKASKWANPFRMGGKSEAERQRAISAYREWLVRGVEFGFPRAVELLAAVGELKGKTLACWCKGTGKSGEDVPCHGDVLRELADGE